MHNGLIRVSLAVVFAFVLAYGIACVIVVPQETAPASSGVESTLAFGESEAKRRIDELQRDLLDYRANQLDRGLATVAIFVAVLALLAAAIGLLGYREFRSNAEKIGEEVKKRGEQAVEEIEELQKRAREAVDKIKQEEVRLFATDSKIKEYLEKF